MTTIAAPRPARKANPRKPAAVSLALSIDHICYLVSPIVPEGDPDTLKAFRLTKKSDDAINDVARTASGLVVCDCPSYVATHEGTSSMCKHGRALVQLGLLDAPSAMAAVAPPPSAPAAIEPNTTIPAEAPAAAVEDPAPCCPDSEPVPCRTAFVDAQTTRIHTDRPRRFGEGLLDPADLPPAKPFALAPLRELADPQPAATIAVPPVAAPEETRLDLAAYVRCQASAYEAIPSSAAHLIASTLRDLAKRIAAAEGMDVHTIWDREIALASA